MRPKGLYQPKSQAPNTASQHTITELGAAFKQSPSSLFRVLVFLRLFFHTADQQATSPGLHSSGLRCSRASPHPTGTQAGYLLPTSASVANAWGGRQFCKPNCSRPQGRTLAPSGLCHRPSQCVCTCFYFTASSTTL